ncbi:SpoIIE family protein phosphatase [uncultured Methylobacterium sp.]|uniref:SpoIIE family protein phosphatase n=1 Tax=uncultured Methylobacterium sp. TaxID=157278 RepID=UPI0035CAA0A5
MISVPVTEASQVADARRRAAALAATLGFDEVAGGRVALVATELATNLVKYGTAGEILLGAFEDDTGRGVEILALETGPGIADLAAALRDGHSTGGSPGTGLGAARRLSQAFDIASWPGRGTAVLARLQARSAGPPAVPWFGAVAVPLRGETVNGDASCARRYGAGWTILVADGLGHGPSAAEASGEAVRLFRSREAEAPAAILSAIHAGLRHTRGGAVAIARYEPERGRVLFCGIGNVAGAVVTGAETKRMVSLAGTAGHVARRFQTFEYPFTPDSLLVMCSDGIGTSWSLDAYPGLRGAHPSLIAGVLYRDFARGRDDATVVIAQGTAAFGAAP